MKDYLINVKCICSMDMIVNSKTKKDAVNKTDKLIKNYISNKKDLGIIFDKPLIFKYKVNRTKK